MPKDERPPYFNFYVDDFVSDGNVEAMTTEEVGAYILLLCKAWREVPISSIPNDDRTLARWARMTPDQWAASKEMVLRPFVLRNDGRLYQKRLRKEFEKLQASVRRKSEAGTSAAKSRWGRKLDADALQTHCDGIANALPNDAISEPESNIRIKDSPPENNTKPARSPAKFVPPTVEEVAAHCLERSNGIDAEAFIAYYEARNWMLGKQKMSKWKAAVTTWEKNKHGPAQAGFQSRRGGQDHSKIGDGEADLRAAGIIP